MNFKTTYILFGVLLGVLGLFLLTQLFAKRTIDQQAYVLPSLHDFVTPVKADDIERIEVERQRPKAEKFVFSKDEHGNWVSKDPNVRLDTNSVKRIIDQVIGARMDPSADLTSDLKRFGLDNPAEIVTLTKKDGAQEWKLNMGDSSAGDDKAMVYVTSSDEPKQPMAVPRSSLDTLFKPLNDFRSKTLLADSAFDITSVALQAPKHDALALEKNTSDNKWRFDKPAFGEADYEGEPAAPNAGDSTARITGVRELLQTVADLRVDNDQDFATTDAADKELADKGLEKGKEHLRVEAKRQPSSFGTSEEKKQPIQETLLIGNKADDKGEKYYARLESDRNIVKVPGKKVEALAKILEAPSVLRSHELLQIDSAKLDAINVKLNDQETLKLRHAGEPAAWKIYEAGKAQDTDMGTVQKLINDLTAKRQVKDFPGFAKTDAELGLDKPTTVVSLWVDGIKKEDKKDEKKDEAAKDDKKDDKTKDDKKDAKADAAKKEEKKDPNAEPALKDDKPTVRLVFGKKDKDVVYVRREAGGETARLAVPAALLDKVSEGKLAYLERKLPSFTTADVTKIVLNRGTDTYEIEKPKDDKANTWKVKQPKDLAGRNADSAKVDRLLGDLRDLQAEKLVAEKATDSEMERYGLKNPVVKATLTERKSDKETKDQVYLFGKETDDKSGIYAKQGGRDTVFVVRKGTLEALQADLQDTKIFAFDIGKVKGLKLQGWHDIIGSTYTLDLERQSSQTWTVKAPPDFKLNTSQVESFLAALINIRAERFLGRQAGSKPEYKLDVKDGALEITIPVEGEKEPATLTIGGPSGGDGLYARSNKFPGEVFILPKGPFEGPKSKPVYFKKE
jgi:hypothetical protein